VVRRASNTPQVFAREDLIDRTGGDDAVALSVRSDGICNTLVVGAVEVVCSITLVADGFIA